MAERIAPEQAREHLHGPNAAYLVCAYDSDEKFQKNHLEGATSLAEFRSLEASMPRDQEVIFYCA